ncbi:MAG: LysE family translocator [Deferrisomatales bacterium]
MIDSQLVPFVSIIAVLTVTPGADTLLVIRSAMERGRAAGLATIGGICSGLAIHAVLSGTGLSLLLVQSSLLYETAKTIGAGYLIYLGLQSVWSATRGKRSKMEHRANEKTYNEGRSRSFCDGLLTNVLNPKVAIFYMAFLPQFIDAGDVVVMKSLALATIHMAFTLVWMLLFVVFIEKMQELFERHHAERRIGALTGVFLVGFGIRLAIDRR